MAHKSLPMAVHPWLMARQRYHLSDAHLQMARELGLNPQKFGSLANQRQEPWKVPLAEFIAALYAKRFGKLRPRSRAFPRGMGSGPGTEESGQAGTPAGAGP